MRLLWAIAGFLVGIVVTALGVGVWQYFGGPGALFRTVNPPAILRQIQALSELVSVKYTVQKVVGLEEQKRPFGQERLLLFVQAEVLAGVDLSSLTPKDVQKVPGGKIRITLPPPRIVQIAIDDKATKVWDHSNTWWTPWVPYDNDMERRARLAARDAIAKAAIEAGILDQARQNAATGITRFLDTLGVKVVVVQSTGEPVSTNGFSNDPRSGSLHRVHARFSAGLR